MPNLIWDTRAHSYKPIKKSECLDRNDVPSITEHKWQQIPQRIFLAEVEVVNINL
jgi:hypothetical protein